MKGPFKFAGVALLAVAVGIAAGLLRFSKTSTPSDGDRDVANEVLPQEEPRPRLSGKGMRRDGKPPLRLSGRVRKKNDKKVRGGVVRDWFEKLPSAADRALAKAIQDAQDSGNCVEVLKTAEVALSSSCDEIRQAAVDALSLQGGNAVSLLQKYLADKNGEIAVSAYRAWDAAVDTIDFEIMRAQAIKAALPRISDREQLSATVDKFMGMDRSYAIREVAKLARDNSGDLAMVAKQTYEQITGEPWVDWATAELKAISARADESQ